MAPTRVSWYAPRCARGVAALRPGQFVEARLNQVADGRALRLPARALLRIEGTDSVFVERDGGFEQVPVEVLSREASQVVVIGPLEVGEAVVVI